MGGRKSPTSREFSQISKFIRECLVFEIEGEKRDEDLGGEGTSLIIIQFPERPPFAYSHIFPQSPFLSKPHCLCECECVFPEVLNF